jgi:hypothetical protein
MAKKSKNTVETTPVVIENQIENQIVPVEVAEVEVADVEVADVVVADLTPEFLNSDLKEKIESSPVYDVTFKHIDAIPVAKRTTDEKIFFFQYKEEVQRLKNNASSIISKSKKKAEELGMTLEQYRESIKDQKGGGKANEYQHEAHYAECDEIFKTKKINTLSSEEKLFWYEVRDEQKRHKACQASKKSILKKKGLLETEVVAEVPVTEVVAEVVVD